MTRRAALAAALSAWLLFACLLPSLAWAQAPAVSIDGAVATPATYTLDGLAGLPAVEVEAVREGGTTARYVGPLLWPLIEAARPLDTGGKGAALQHVLYARGADGYAVALAIGELRPDFEGKPVILAFKADGALLRAPRLVIPGDRKAGRDVRDLVQIEVR